MSNRRDFLKQLGLLSVAVGSGLSLPALAPRTRWCGLPIPLLTEAQKDAVVRHWTRGILPSYIQNRSAIHNLEEIALQQALPEGVRFARRVEDRWGTHDGVALSVTRHGHRTKHAIGWLNKNLESPGYHYHMAVDLLCDWYDHTGCEMIALPEAKVVVYTPEQLQHMGEA